MIALGFDTSTRATAVGLRLADATTLQARDDPAPGEHPGHATRLLGMADALLSQAHLPWTDLQRIAVGLGPGRFTGLRVGVATARGLAQSLAVSLVGVPTLRALAEPALASGPGNEQVLAVIDAQRVGDLVRGKRLWHRQGTLWRPAGHGAVARQEHLAAQRVDHRQHPLAAWP